MKLFINKYSIAVFFLLSCSGTKNLPLTSLVKSVYYDTTVKRTGALLADPTQIRQNDLPDLIYLSKKKILFPDIFERITSNFDTKENLFEHPFSNQEIAKLIEMKIIDTNISVKKNNQINFLGTIYFNHLILNRTKSKAYISYSYSDKKERALFSTLTEMSYHKGKWKVTKEINTGISN
jgi:hypothetical protein